MDRFTGKWGAALGAVLMVSLHASFVPKLGLYHDDWSHFVRPYLDHDGDVQDYIVSGGDGRVSSQRPLMGVALASIRASFAIAGVAGMHGWMLLLHVIVALLLVRLVRDLCPRHPGLAVWAGFLQFLNPLAPGMLFWPSNVHHYFSMILALISMRALWHRHQSPSRWNLAVSLLAYGASLLPSEIMAFVPLGFAVLVPWIQGGTPTPGIPERSILRGCLSNRMSLYMGMILAAWLAWRVFLQPLYGWDNYGNPTGESLLDPGRWVSGWLAYLNPWPVMAGEIGAFRSGIAGFSVVLVAAVLPGIRAFREACTVEREPERGAQRFGVLRRMLILGLVLTAAGMAPAVLSQASLHQLTGSDVRMSSGGLLGSSWALASVGLLFLEGLLRGNAGAGIRMSCLAGIFLSLLGFVIRIAAQEGSTHLSGPARQFALVQAGGLLIEGGVLVGVAGLAFLLHRKAERYRRVVAWIAGAGVAGMLFLCLLFQVRVLDRRSTEWSERLSMIRSLSALAPRFTSETFVLIEGLDQRPGIEGLNEVTTVLGVLYGDPTLLGSTPRWVTYTREGVKPYLQGKALVWPYHHRWAVWHAGERAAAEDRPIGTIGPDRIVFLDWRDGVLSILSEHEVLMEDGSRPVMQSNVHRIEQGDPATLRWRREILGF